MNRILFLWFLQVKGFLNSDTKYLITKFQENSKGNYYTDFLCQLFFRGLCINEEDRDESINKLIGSIPFLNGGLFLPSEEELKYEKKIEIPNKVFYKQITYPLSADITELPILPTIPNKISPSSIGVLL